MIMDLIFIVLLMNVLISIAMDLSHLFLVI